MTPSNGLLLGVRKEIARLWNVKGNNMQSPVIPLNIANVQTADTKNKKPPQFESGQEKNTGAMTENIKIRLAADIEKNRCGGTTFIGEHITIEGSIHADEDIEIEGSVKGNIICQSHQLTVGKKGRIEADIQASSIAISGKVSGNITAFNTIRINKTADISGQIKAKSVSVEDGAFLKASIELDKEPKEKPQMPQHHVEAILFTSDAHGQKTIKSDTSRISLQ
jgi:cytoskeletal protein CcmA (bactofilin family)